MNGRDPPRAAGPRRAFLETTIPPPIWCLAFAAAMWLLDREAPGARLDAGLGRPLGIGAAVVVALAGTALTGEAGLRFFRARTTVHPLRPAEASKLVVTGTYRYTRNPMYRDAAAPRRMGAVARQRVALARAAGIRVRAHASADRP